MGVFLPTGGCAGAAGQVPVRVAAACEVPRPARLACAGACPLLLYAVSTASRPCTRTCVNNPQRLSPSLSHVPILQNTHSLHRGPMYRVRCTLDSAHSRRPRAVPLARKATSSTPRPSPTDPFPPSFHRPLHHHLSTHPPGCRSSRSFDRHPEVPRSAQSLLASSTCLPPYLPTLASDLHLPSRSSVLLHDLNLTVTLVARSPHLSKRLRRAPSRSPILPERGLWGSLDNGARFMTSIHD